jgi:hypothetical protein
MTQIYLHKSKANSLEFAVPSKDMKKEHMIDYFFSVAMLLTKFKKYAVINAFSGISIKNIAIIRVILIYLSISFNGFLKNKIKDNNGLIKYWISILFFVSSRRAGA